MTSLHYDDIQSCTMYTLYNVHVQCTTTDTRMYITRCIRLSARDSSRMLILHHSKPSLVRAQRCVRISELQELPPLKHTFYLQSFKQNKNSTPSSDVTTAPIDDERVLVVAVVELPTGGATVLMLHRYARGLNVTTRATMRRLGDDLHTMQLL